MKARAVWPERTTDADHQGGAVALAGFWDVWPPPAPNGSTLGNSLRISRAAVQAYSATEPRAARRRLLAVTSAFVTAPFVLAALLFGLVGIRVAGRYDDIAQERSADRTIFPLGEEKVVNLCGPSSRSAFRRRAC